MKGSGINAGLRSSRFSLLLDAGFLPSEIELMRYKHLLSSQEYKERIHSILSIRLTQGVAILYPAKKILPKYREWFWRTYFSNILKTTFDYYSSIYLLLFPRICEQEAVRTEMRRLWNIQRKIVRLNLKKLLLWIEEKWSQYTEEEKLEESGIR